MSQERMNMSTYQKTALGTTMAGLGMQSCSTMLLSYVLTSIIADFAISSTAVSYTHLTLPTNSLV